MRNNGQILMPSQEQIQMLQAQQQFADQQQDAIQKAFALENARCVASLAATLYAGADDRTTPQEAVELACEFLFRSVTTLSLPRTKAREAEVRAALSPAAGG